MQAVTTELQAQYNNKPAPDHPLMKTLNLPIGDVAKVNPC